MDDLKERLRAYEALIVDYADALEKSDDFADTVIGSDLREGSVVIDSALARIEALEQHVSGLEEALPIFERVIRLAHTLSSDVPITADAMQHITRAYEALAALNREPNP
jgi:exonuclease VII small subunit